MKMKTGSELTPGQTPAQTLRRSSEAEGLCCRLGSGFQWLGNARGEGRQGHPYRPPGLDRFGCTFPAQQLSPLSLSPVALLAAGSDRLRRLDAMETHCRCAPRLAGQKGERQ